MLRRKLSKPFSWDPYGWEELPQEWVEKYTQEFTYEQWYKIAANTLGFPYCQKDGYVVRDEHETRLTDTPGTRWDFDKLMFVPHPEDVVLPPNFENISTCRFVLPSDTPQDVVERFIVDTHKVVFLRLPELVLTDTNDDGYMLREFFDCVSLYHSWMSVKHNDGEHSIYTWSDKHSQKRLVAEHMALDRMVNFL